MKKISLFVLFIGMFCTAGITSAAINNLNKGLPAMALLLLKPSVQTLSGQFLDSKVIGMPYRTETMSGVTDFNGTFQYKRGESV